MKKQILRKKFVWLLTIFFLVSSIFNVFNGSEVKADNNFLGSNDYTNNLGIANDFNIFVLGNHTESNSDSEGRVAVGGAATYRNFSVGSKTTSSTTRADLIVGQQIDIIGATNFSGNTTIGTSGKVVNYTMTNNNGVKNPIVEDVINFNAASNYLNDLSQSLSKLSSNGQVSLQYNMLSLKGTDPQLNVFEVDGANIQSSGVSLDKLNTINIDTPEDSTVLINVTGNNIGFGQGFGNNYKGRSIDGNDKNDGNSVLNKILWNFPDATSAFNGNSIAGSLLAPNASWDVKGSCHINGTIIVKNLNCNNGANIEAHDYKFYGHLPNSDSPTGAVELTKTDKDSGAVLKGAEFNLLDSQNKVIGTYTTDENGKISVYGLTLGDYSFVETKAPDGYVLDTTPIKFTIKAEQTSTVKLTAADVKQTGAVELTKTDRDSGAVLKGAEFNLLDSQNKVIGTYTTDQNGKISVSGLVLGDYSFVETKAPDGYVLDSAPITFTIKAGLTSPVKLTATNTKQTGTVELTKTDKDSGAVLKGAEFNLLDSQNKVIGTYTTDDNGKISVSALTLGDYSFVETKAPDGYVLDTTPIKFTIKANQDYPLSLSASNTKQTGAVELTKTDKDSGAALKGAEFNLLDSQNKVIGTYTTDQNGKISVYGLALGDYSFVETKAPDGYVLDSAPITFTIKADQTSPVKLTAADVKQPTTNTNNGFKGSVLPQTGGIPLSVPVESGLSLIALGLYLVKSKK